MVVMAGINDDEITDFARKTVTDGWNVRYIELMPVSSNEPVSDKLVSVGEMKKRIEKIGKLEPSSIEVGNGPAKYFRLPGGTGTIGFISPVTEHFCFQCNRLRLTADGKLRSCLLSEAEVDLKGPLRSGAPIDELKTLIGQAIANKPKGHHLAEEIAHKGRPFSQVGG
jgi:GTP 3',8-cyclase